MENKKRVNLNERQKYAIRELIKHVFGDFETYDYYRKHKDSMSFPYYYKVTKDFFIKSPWINKEYADAIIAGVPVAIVDCKITHSKKAEDGEGSKGPSNKGGYDYISLAKAMIDIQKSEKGSRAKGNAWNPLEFKTFKQRISSYQSFLRRHNCNEEAVSDAANFYTETYNKRFETNFEAYHSKKKVKKN